MAQDPHAWLSAECKPTASTEAKFAEPPTMYRPFGCVTDSEPDEPSSPESPPWLHPEIFMVSLSDSDDEHVAGESRAVPIVEEDTEMMVDETEAVNLGDEDKEMMVDETEAVNLGDEDGIKTDEQGIATDVHGIATDGAGIEDMDESRCNGKRKLPESWKGKEIMKEKDDGKEKVKEKDDEADEGSRKGKEKVVKKDEKASERPASGSSMDFVNLVIAALAVGKTGDESEDDENEHWFDMIQRKGFTFPKPRWWP